MSVIKLLSRIVKPSQIGIYGPSLHDHSYGITSDPLTQFACAFSALIHDADHPGVPNGQLVKENASLASKFQHRSVAEQHSLYLTLDLLSDDRFSNLHDTLFATSADQQRFRSLVVGCVLSTDIVDKDLKTLRNSRWDTAFAAEHREESNTTTVNRKATIVIEHLIQASDVAHTMQHWNIYRVSLMMPRVLLCIPLNHTHLVLFSLCPMPEMERTVVLGNVLRFRGGSFDD